MLVESMELSQRSTSLGWGVVVGNLLLQSWHESSTPEPKWSFSESSACKPTPLAIAKNAAPQSS